jgi:hypothetical protein
MSAKEKGSKKGSKFQKPGFLELWNSGTFLSRKRSEKVPKKVPKCHSPYRGWHLEPWNLLRIADGGVS